MNVYGLLAAWGLAVLCFRSALYAPTWPRRITYAALAGGFVLTTAAFLWHVRRGEP